MHAYIAYNVIFVHHSVLKPHNLMGKSWRKASSIYNGSYNNVKMFPYEDQHLTHYKYYTGDTSHMHRLRSIHVEGHYKLKCCEFVLYLVAFSSNMVHNTCM